MANVNTSLDYFTLKTKRSHHGYSKYNKQQSNKRSKNKFTTENFLQKANQWVLFPLVGKPP